MHFARQHAVSPTLSWHFAPLPDVCSGAGGIPAMQRFQLCPGSMQRMFFPLTLAKAERESCVGAWGLVLLLPFQPLFLDPQFLLCTLPAKPSRAAPFEKRAWPTFLSFDTERSTYLCLTTFSISVLVTPSWYKMVLSSISQSEVSVTIILTIDLCYRF